MKRSIFIALLLSTSAACGGGSSSAPPAEGPPGGPADAGPSSGGDLEGNKAAFVASCSKNQPGTEGYCGCAWEVARKTYGDEKMSASGAPSEEDLAKIHVKIAGECSSEFPPEVIERAFMEGCTKKKKELAQYCSCTWSELVQKIPAAELVVERSKRSERYEAAVGSATKACAKLRPSR